MFRILDVSPTSYLSFAKIQSGLNNDELDFLNKKLQPYWETSADNQNRGLFWGREKPEMWIPPEKSCILIVHFTYIVLSKLQISYTVILGSRF